jgi:hypothetical protein
MTMPRPSLVTVENYDTLRESIPSFFMREISVVRLTPIRIAAPLGPATRPCVSSSTRRISSRSLDSRGLDVGTAAPARLSSRPELQERCREFKDGCRSMTAPSIEGQYYATACFLGTEAAGFAAPFPRRPTSSRFTSSACVQVTRCGPSFTTT